MRISPKTRGTFVIVSASRRTDIPAFYSEWFMNRVRAGFCLVPNPFNPNQISRVSLDPAEVEAIVFWTRHPGPLFAHLDELDARGFRYYFLYTLMANPRPIDPGSPAVEIAIETFRELSERIGPERVIWRYDPVFFSRFTGPEFHLGAYRRISEGLQGYTRRSIVSIVHVYRKIQKRLTALCGQGIDVLPQEGEAAAMLIPELVRIAGEHGMELQSCADEHDLQRYGIQPGKCVDDELIWKTFGVKVDSGKDNCQRKRCGCVASKDIGMYDSCLFGCVYCYATASFERARSNYRRHDPEAPSLIPWRSSLKTGI